MFDYLVKGFIEDYTKKWLIQEKAGWRTLTEIATKTKLTKSTFYVKGGRGPIIDELSRRGLIDNRFFTGERGRGGKVLRVRIDIEKSWISDSIKKSIESDRK